MTSKTDKSPSCTITSGKVRPEAGTVTWFDATRALERALQNQYAGAQDFRAAVGDFYGREAFVRAPAAPAVYCVACPACRSLSAAKGNPARRYPIVVEDHGESWTASAWCGCPLPVILRALLRGQRDRIDAELHALDRLEAA